MHATESFIFRMSARDKKAISDDISLAFHTPKAGKQLMKNSICLAKFTATFEIRFFHVDVWVNKFHRVLSLEKSFLRGYNFFTASFYGIFRERNVAIELINFPQQ